MAFPACTQALNTPARPGAAAPGPTPAARPLSARPLSSNRLFAALTPTQRRIFCDVHANRQYHRLLRLQPPSSIFLASSGAPRRPCHPVRGQSSRPAHSRCARKRPPHHTFLTPTDIIAYVDSPSPFRLRPPCGPALWAPCRLRPHEPLSSQLLGPKPAHVPAYQPGRTR